MKIGSLNGEFIEETIINALSALLLFILFVIQFISFKYEQKSRHYATILLILSIIAGNMISSILQLILLNAFPSCSICIFGFTINRLLFVSIRCLNRLFFIFRGKEIYIKLNPFYNSDDKYRKSINKRYDKILPTIIIIIYLVLISGIASMQSIEAMNNHDFNNTECVQINQSHKTCINYSDINATKYANNLYLFATMISVIANLIILYIFIKPLLCHLCDNSMAINLQYNDLEEQTKWKYGKELKINICLMIINMISSQVIINGYSLSPQYFWFFPSIDNLINVITIYLMIGNNRHFMIKMLFYIIECCLCRCCINLKQKLKLMPSNTPSIYPTKMMKQITNSDVQWNYEDQIGIDTIQQNMDIDIHKRPKLTLDSIDDEETYTFKRRISSWDQNDETESNGYIHDDDDDDGDNFKQQNKMNQEMNE